MLNLLFRGVKFRSCTTYSSWQLGLDHVRATFRGVGKLRDRDIDHCER